MLSMAREIAPPPASSDYRSEDTPQIHRTCQVTNIRYQLVLPPVCIALVERDGQRGLALVNGRSGKVAFGPQLLARQGREDSPKESVEVESD